VLVFSTIYGWSWRVCVACRGSVVLVRLGVEAPGFVELVFQDDDATGCVQGGALVEQFPDSSGQSHWERE
jgi:hypothetical protein